jgi:hypothetical protein
LYIIVHCAIIVAMRVIPVTEGRKRLGELMDIVRYQHTIIALGKNGKAEALLVAIPGVGADFSMTSVNAASESFQFLDDEPNLYSRKDIKKSYV